ncbi:MAG: caspase family protein [Planctomycetota bacterium]
MDRFLVRENAQTGPSTHALVIGVGKYPFLNGGDGGRLFQDHAGMGQLTSPPVSAMAVADWLAHEFDHPDKPLGSISLLVSAEDPVTFPAADAGAPPTEVAPATFANVKQASLDWKKRGDSEPKNMMLFFFCGHGIADGAKLALLTEDYGEDDDAGLAHAVDFNRFHMGMERCKGRHQCFFVDACRTQDDSLEEAQGYAGDPILTPTVRRDREAGLRLKPAFFSTLEGTKAHSQKNQPSRFTRALLQSFAGGGADDLTGQWWVDTNQIQKSVQWLMDRAKRLGFTHTQINPVDSLSTLRLHRLSGAPQVPVAVSCRPETKNAEAALSYASTAKQGQHDPAPEGWDLELPPDDYEFAATSSGTIIAEKQQYIRPPHREVDLEVEP